MEKLETNTVCFYSWLGLVNPFLLLCPQIMFVTDLKGPTKHLQACRTIHPKVREHLRRKTTTPTRHGAQKVLRTGGTLDNPSQSN